MVWVIYNVVGFMKQGPLHYFKNSAWPAGVPMAINILLGRPDRVRVGLHRPAVLAGRPTLRQHARRSPHPGDVRRAVRGALGAERHVVVILPFSFVLLVFLTAFEVLVSFLQAFIFTILTAVYIGSSMHPDH